MIKYSIAIVVESINREKSELKISVKNFKGNKMKFLILILATISSINSLTLNCPFKTLNWANYVGEAYTCYYPTLSNLYETQQITAVSGTHEDGKSNSDVKVLNIGNNVNLTYFPRAIENFFPNLIAIYISSTNITYIRGDELLAFPKLTNFQIAVNPSFERVPGNLFSNNPLLQVVSFYKNNIKHVGEGIMNGLKNLKWIEFNRNYCVNQLAYPADFPTLIEFLRTNCTVVEPQTTTTTTTPAPICGDINEVVCALQSQNRILIEKITSIESKIDQILDGQSP